MTKQDIKFLLDALFNFIMSTAGIVLFLGAWFTHIIVCIKAGAWGLLIAGAIFFPIGFVHGWGVWLGFF